MSLFSEELALAEVSLSKRSCEPYLILDRFCTFTASDLLATTLPLCERSARKITTFCTAGFQVQFTVPTEAEILRHPGI